MDLWLIDWLQHQEPLPWYLKNTNQWLIDLPLLNDNHEVVVALQNYKQSLLPQSDIENEVENTNINDIEQRYAKAELLLTDNPERIDHRVNTKSSGDIVAAAEALSLIEQEESLSELIPPTAQSVSRIQQKRRIKRGEVHYFDHPNFGVIVVVQKWSEE
jgi:hypothetical protein